MSVFSPKDINELYWASNEGFKAGRDPMGIENSSVATYGCLLPGLTNLTRRIRYYSFYCWLLNEYDYEGKQRFMTHQHNFVRRAELAMAFIEKDQQEMSIPGAWFIQYDTLDEINPGVYNLAQGADYYPNKVNYWTYPLGALGQYYLGSLVVLRLIHLEEKRYYVYSKGKELAEAFRQSTPATVRERFLECVERGQITEEDALFLQPVAIGTLAQHTPEWVMLNEILTADGESRSSMRRESIKLMLEAIHNKISVDKFPEYQYGLATKAKPDSAAFGWYFFYLCEVLHYAVETVLWLVLEMAFRLNYQPVHVHLAACEEAILEHTPETSKAVSVRDSLLWNTESIPNLLAELCDAVNARECEIASGLAVNLLCRLYNEVMPRWKEIREFEDKNDLTRQFGILSSFIERYVSRNLDLPYERFVHWTVMEVMQDHTISACRKMGTSNVDLRKFMKEDGCIVHVETRYPQFTSPRTQSLYSFLCDMGYVDSENNLTEIASKFLDNYDN